MRVLSMIISTMVIPAIVAAADHRSLTPQACLDCSDEPENRPAGMSMGEWILRCRYRDAQPQYLLDSLGRVLDTFSTEKHRSIKGDRFAFLKEPEVQQAVFETYGIIFDDIKREFPVPLGMNRTFEKLFPIMLNDGKVAYSRLVGKTPRDGVSVNCLICHVSIVPTEVNGRGAISFGTPNVFIDLQKIHEHLSEDLANHEQRSFPGAGSVGSAIERNPIRNSFVNSSDLYGVISRVVRNPFPKLDRDILLQYFYEHETKSQAVEGLREVSQSQPYVKTQPWASFKYKMPHQKLYVDGGFSGNPATVTYRLAFILEKSGHDYQQHLAEFENYVPDFLTTISPPKYPFPIDGNQVSKGHAIYQRNCAKCHGDFRRNERGGFELDYPASIVADVGTDDQRYRFYAEIVPHFIRHHQLEDKPIDLEAKVNFHRGYIAPPLVGIWARAPYLHNASVANVRQLLERPSSRSRKFGIWPRPADHEFYDQKNVGWKSIDLSGYTDPDIAVLMTGSSEYSNLRVYSPDIQFRNYDQRRVLGLDNRGHDLGRPPFQGYLKTTEIDQLLEFLKSI